MDGTRWCGSGGDDGVARDAWRVNTEGQQDPPELLPADAIRDGLDRSGGYPDKRRSLNPAKDTSDILWGIK